MAQGANEDFRTLLNTLPENKRSRLESVLGNGRGVTSPQGVTVAPSVSPRSTAVGGAAEINNDLSTTGATVTTQRPVETTAQPEITQISTSNQSFSIPNQLEAWSRSRADGEYSMSNMSDGGDRKLKRAKVELSSEQSPGK